VGTGYPLGVSRMVGLWQVAIVRITMGLVQITADSAVATMMSSWFGSHPVLGPSLALALIVAAAWISFSFVRRYLLRVVNSVTRRTQVWWDELLFSPELVERLAWFIPLVI